MFNHRTCDFLQWGRYSTADKSYLTPEKVWQTLFMINLMGQFGINLLNLILPRKLSEIPRWEVQRKITICICDRKSTPIKLARTVNFANLIKVQTQKTNALTSHSHFAVWNARSVKVYSKPKVASLCEFIISKQLDIVCLTKPWLTGTEKDNRTIADIQKIFPHFDFLHIPRKSKTGGGVCVLLRKGFQVCQNNDSDDSFRSFEHIDPPSALVQVLFYWWRSTGHHHLRKTSSRYQTFLLSFSTRLEPLTFVNSNRLLTGDFNFHVDVHDDREALQFLGSLASCGLKQHV